MVDEKCLFCKIGAKEEPAEFVWEDEEFMCIKNKYPVAPVHLLVIPKDHRVKTEWNGPTSLNLRGAKLPVSLGQFWGKMMAVVFLVVCQLGLDKTGYKLVNNGGGYNHFEHEHMHILGGTKKEPAGTT